MATIDIRSSEASPVLPPRTTAEPSALGALRRVVEPLASLKLTVAVFAMAILLIFVGTLAQSEQDIWQVMTKYFRAPYVWVPLQVFFPPAFFPSRPQVPGGFPFPGGFTLLALAFVNLTAAHALRFKVQARGSRLTTGLAVIAVGIVMTVLVILGGDNKEGVLEVSWVDWSSLWKAFLAMLGAGWFAAVYGLKNIERSRRIERAVLGIIVVGLGALLAVLLYQGDAGRLNDSAMRILWQLMKGSMAALVLLAGCALVFKKRAGVVLLHAGVGLMMINELVVYQLHVESRMAINKGQTVNWTQDIRHLELAIIDPSNPDSDDVVVVPEGMLQSGKRLTDPRLPCDVELVQFFPNSQLRPLGKNETSEATAGSGADFTVEERRPGTGTDMSAAVDMASAYVKFIPRHGAKADEKPETLLLSQMFSMRDMPQPLNLGGKKYNVYLRFQHIYKPYAVRLDDVSQTNYLGTNTPRDYRSIVTIKDEQLGIDRDNVNIWMNNPLRFAGETFYQSEVSIDPMTGKLTGTTLQVVTNTAWMIPYVAVTIVSAGMLAHFLGTLSRFLARRREMAEGVRSPGAKGKASRVAVAPQAMWTDRLVPLAVVLIFAAWVFSAARIPTAPIGGLDLYAFGALPLAYEGRVKPYDTLARTSLRAISGREIYSDPPPNEKQDKTLYETLFGARPKSHPAIEWLLDVMADSHAAAEHRVFQIANFDVLDTLGLERRKRFRYAIGEFHEHAERFEAEVAKAKAAQKADKYALSTYEKKLLQFNGKVNVYMAIDAAFHPAVVPDFPTQDEIDKNPEGARKKLIDSMSRVRMAVEDLNSRDVPLAVPAETAGEPLTEKSNSNNRPWIPYANAVIEAYVQRTIGHEAREPVVMLATIFDAYGKARSAQSSDVAEKEAAEFNQAVAKYRRWLVEHPPTYSDVAGGSYRAGFEWMLTHAFGFTPSPFLKSDFEAFFNHWDPFNLAWYCYITAFTLTALSWLGWSRPLNRSAFWLIVFALAVHTVALASRIYISGRPPVTNLYSAAVFIGWGAVVLGLVFEAIYGMGIGNVVASVAGFASLLVAHMLAVINGSDTFVVLQAVLDTQFWLATHVTCITMGYATTYVAGLLGLIYVLRGVLTPSLTAETGKNLARMIYGTLCFAIFFSAVGTVLGGLWADDSWGRFWGWDPKENGALIIVLWNALVLHARWGAIVAERGMAVLAIFGNIVTSWSFFGVNELGVGLHSYGFTEGVLLALGLFCLSQLIVIALGMLPKHRWWSSRTVAGA
ncbi:MAG TPA: cytochrome c biogenesis protein CcsA [Pirellulales bacterium]|jgi:ABC-type transport system involved in cytochrome c biogenesis permease subunit|nr:cytochrome c biogenesis protein CcsA [Pirellulales bacterium]